MALPIAQTLIGTCWDCRIVQAISLRLVQRGGLWIRRNARQSTHGAQPALHEGGAGRLRSI
jgi:hypothetical protein